MRRIAAALAALFVLSTMTVITTSPAAAMVGGDPRPPVYLTFDDGPGPYTGAVLDLLDRYRARATFFMVGYRVEADPVLARRVQAAGHAVANHTWSHPQLTSLSDDAVRYQLGRAQQAFAATLGVTPTCFRPPYGATSSRVIALQNEVGLTNAGWTVKPGAYQSVISPHVGTWDVDTSDYRRRESTVRSVLATIEAGDVVLMHDIHPTSLAPLADWLAANADRYRLEPLPGCGGRPWNPNEGRAPVDYYQFQVGRLYVAYFGRYPDDSGWTYWNDRYQRGATLIGISVEFARSVEFVNRYGALDNIGFVDLVYRNVLGRRPDPDGAAYWEAKLASGLSRGELMLYFADGAEFRIRSAPALTGDCHRPADMPASFTCAAKRLGY